MASISDEAWAEVEQSLGRPLPDALRDLLEEAAGEELLGGNLNVHPLTQPDGDEEALALTSASDLLRSWEWPVPDELVVFGDNGQGDSFGVWAPRGGGARPVVVQIGEVFEDACLAVVADDIESFVRGWGAYYILLLGDSGDVATMIAELELPDELASLEEDGSDDEFYAILRWASPGLPDPRPDPYERGMTAEQVNQFAALDRR